MVGRRDYLVGGSTTHLKNISQNGNLPLVGVKIKKYLNPPPSYTFILGPKRPIFRSEIAVSFRGELTEHLGTTHLLKHVGGAEETSHFSGGGNAICLEKGEGGWRKRTALLDWCWTLFGVNGCTLQGTNKSHQKSLLKMIFLFPRWDMLIPWRVFASFFLVDLCRHISSKSWFDRFWSTCGSVSPNTILSMKNSRNKIHCMSSSNIIKYLK